jgi:predicted RNA-binding Zn ribbon-like protein
MRHSGVGTAPRNPRAFRFDTGSLATDFAATVGDRLSEASVERMPAPADLARWCVAEGLLEMSAPVTPEQYSAAVALREAIYRLARGSVEGAEPGVADVELLNEWARQPVAAPQLDASGLSLVWVAVDRIEAALAAVARDAVLLLGREREALRACEAADCRMLFVDTSRSRRRRWCSMAECGNRNKAAAYRQRHGMQTQTRGARDAAE